MDRFYSGVIRYRKPILVFYLILFCISIFWQSRVKVNYDINSYLPEDTASTVALDVMEEEFDGGIPNARVMISNVTIAEALEYKDKIKETDGVTEVTW